MVFGYISAWTKLFWISPDIAVVEYRIHIRQDNGIARNQVISKFHDVYRCMGKTRETDLCMPKKE